MLPLENLRTAHRAIIATGILLPALTALSYLTAYFYEISYLSYFKIDRELVEVGIASFIFSLVTLFLIVILYVLLVIISRRSKEEVDIKKRMTFDVIFFGLPLAISGISLKFMGEGMWWLVTLAFILGITIMSLFENIVRTKKFDKVIDTRVDIRSKKFLKNASFVHTSIYLLISLLLVMSSGVIAGNLVAMNKKKFVILSTQNHSEKYVLIKAYSSKYIFAGINGNKLSGETKIIPSDQAVQLYVKELRLER